MKKLKLNTGFIDFWVLTALLFIAGIAFVAAPVGAINVLLRIIGIVTLVYVIADIVIISIAAPVHGAIFTATITAYVFTGVCALVLATAPADAFRFLTLIAGIYLVADGFIGIYGIAVRRIVTPGYSFALTLVCRIALTVFGIWLIVSPAGVQRTTAILLGIALLFTAVSRALRAVVSGQLRSGFEYPFSNHKRANDTYIEGEFTDVSDDKPDSDDTDNGTESDGSGDAH